MEDQKEPVLPKEHSGSVGEKWANIFREKGLGMLRGKFHKDWGYVDKEGIFHTVLSRRPYEQGEFSGGGEFGEYKSIYGGHPATYNKEVNGEELMYDKDYWAYKANALIIANVDPYFSKYPELNGWIVFDYRSWLNPTTTPDKLFSSLRSGPLNLHFNFALPSKESSEFLSEIGKNPDLVEDVFQKMYPRLTGEKGLKRLVVDRLKIINKIVALAANLPREARFSHSVGEASWNH